VSKALGRGVEHNEQSVRWRSLNSVHEEHCHAPAEMDGMVLLMGVCGVDGFGFGFEFGFRGV